MAFVDQCPRCGGGIREGDHEAVVRGGTNVVLVSVRAGMCDHCGEVLYEPATVRRFEEIRRQLQAGQVSAFTPVGQAYRA